VLFAGIYEARGAATSGNSIPSSDKRALNDINSPFDRSLEIRDHVLSIGARNNLHKFPPVLPPRVEYLLGGMDEQRHGCVFPRRHAGKGSR